MDKEKWVREFKVDAEVENIWKVTEFVDRLLEEKKCPTKVQMQIDIAVDEIISNIVHYAYTSSVGTVLVRVRFMYEPMAVMITFIDSGVPYNPLLNEDPDTSLPVEERRAGGLGIYMVKKSMDSLSYEYKNGENMLTIVKHFNMNKKL